jgi:hypothetical protein
MKDIEERGVQAASSPVGVGGAAAAEAEGSAQAEPAGRA